MKRTVAIVTVARSDFGIYRPVLALMENNPVLSPRLVVGGAHLCWKFGHTVDEITAAGFPIGERAEFPLAAGEPAGVAVAMGTATAAFGRALARLAPDLVVVLGDRYEMHSAALAATAMQMPLAHIHGGEVTEGAMDDALRHAITKYSHLHFVSTADHARRVIQLGEAPWRVTISGAPGLDNLRSTTFLTRETLEAMLRLDLQKPTLLVTFHPVTLQLARTEQHVAALLAALEKVGGNIVFTYPGADAEHERIVGAVQHFVRRHAGARLVTSLGTAAYFSLMRYAAAMVGNSSSGIIEAASLELPVVNVGDRQRGRPHGENVIDADCTVAEIVRAVERATEPSFRRRLRGMSNPYGDGDAATRIVERLRTVDLDERLLIKRFHDLPELRRKAA